MFFQTGIERINSSRKSCRVPTSKENDKRGKHTVLTLLVGFMQTILSKLSYKCTKFKSLHLMLFPQLEEKVETLEKSLTHVIREFEVERMAIVKKSVDDNKDAM